MTEEVLQEVSKAVDNDPYADLAQQYGWNPEKGDKNAKQFIEYAMQNLEPRGKELKEVKQTLAELKSHMEEQRQQAYLQAVKELEQRKYAAVQSGDVAAVEEVYKESQKLNPVKPSNPLDAFDLRHADMINDASLEAFEIREFVKTRYTDLLSKKLDPEDHVKIVEQDMYKKFPTYFGVKAPTSAVVKDTESGSVIKTDKKYSYSDLNKEQKEVANFMKSRGVPVEKYIESLKTSGAL